MKSQYIYFILFYCLGMMGGMQGMPNSGMPGNIQAQQGMQAGGPIHFRVLQRRIMQHAALQISIFNTAFGPEASKNTVRVAPKPTNSYNRF